MANLGTIPKVERSSRGDALPSSVRKQRTVRKQRKGAGWTGLLAAVWVGWAIAGGAVARAQSEPPATPAPETDEIPSEIDEILELDEIVVPGLDEGIPTEPTVERLTEAIVREQLDLLVAATNARDIDAILERYASDATFELAIATPVGPQVQRFAGRQQVATLLNFAYSSIEDLETSYSNLAVLISEDGQSALATYRYDQNATIQGVPMEISADAFTTFALIGGRPTIVTDRSIDRAIAPEDRPDFSTIAPLNPTEDSAAPDSEEAGDRDLEIPPGDR